MCCCLVVNKDHWVHNLLVNSRSYSETCSFIQSNLSTVLALDGNSVHWIKQVRYFEIFITVQALKHYIYPWSFSARLLGPFQRVCKHYYILLHKLCQNLSIDKIFQKYFKSDFPTDKIIQLKYFNVIHLNSSSQLIFDLSS